MTDQEIRELEILRDHVRFYSERDHPAYGDGCGDYKEYDEERRREREKLKFFEEKARLNELEGAGNVARAVLFSQKLC